MPNNQLPTTKIVTCRADTNRQTNKQTNKPTEIVKTEGPFEFFLVILFLDFFIDERSNNKTRHIKGR